MCSEWLQIQHTIHCTLLIVWIQFASEKASTFRLSLTHQISLNTPTYTEVSFAGVRRSCPLPWEPSREAFPSWPHTGWFLQQDHHVFLVLPPSLLAMHSGKQFSVEIMSDTVLVFSANLRKLVWAIMLLTWWEKEKKQEEGGGPHRALFVHGSTEMESIN